MVFNTTFNNNSGHRSSQSIAVLLVEEIGIAGENDRPAASHWQTWSHNVVSSTPRLSGIRTCNVSGDRQWLQESPRNCIAIANLFSSVLWILIVHYEDLQFVFVQIKEPHTAFFFLLKLDFNIWIFTKTNEHSLF